MRPVWTAAVIGALGLAAPPGGASGQPDGLAIARAFREAHGSRILRDFAGLLAVPNVAADSAGISRNAVLIAERLRARGASVEVLTLPGAAPLVFAELRVPGAARTLGLYAHYDGQPVDSAIDPEWRVYARSAGDDKAPIAALLAVLEALEQSDAPPTSNVVIFLDGEEEAGSPHLGTYLDLRNDRLADVDAWLFLDGPVHQSGRPQIAFGARGVTGMQVTVYGALRSLHSGHYGGWAPVPGQMLAELLATMKDSAGTVLVDGFYDSAEPVGAAEWEAIARLPAWDRELMEELGLLWTEGAPASLAERLLLPSLTVRGLASGTVGARTRNVIPSTATAALGVRLVKGNEPDTMLDLLEAHIRRQGYHVVRDEPDLSARFQYPRIAKVEREHGYRAVRTPMEGPVVSDLVRAAGRAAMGDLVLLPTLGGSLPLYLFTDRFDAPVLVVPIANHDNNQHAPDENLRVGNLWYGVDLYGAILTMP
jgi:acetylornithine deacetylase/succinyl-diaminopimelate desuccinylase-like protein